jgi:NADPH-dependent 2,4-dienoyl-CoA reductase/sulfur reductase-like enzyme
MKTRLLIVGGVAGGATAAARARRLDESAEIILFERGEYISFANCGLPYYIGDIIKNRDDLFLTTAEDFSKRYNIDVRIQSEVLSINRKNKELSVKNILSDEIYIEKYDKIILSPGAEPFKPPLEGITDERIFTLRNIPDSDRIKKYVDSMKPKKAVIVGGGFIGLEMAENLVKRGINLTIVEMLNQVMAPIDYEIAAIIHRELIDKGVVLELENGVNSFSKNGSLITVVTTKGKKIDCDMVIMSIGVHPENNLAKESGLEIGNRGGI